MHISREHVGYYTAPEQTEPEHTPPTTGPCPFCGEPITPETIRTINVMPVDRSTKASLFYFVHRKCHDAATPEQGAALDETVLRMFGAWQNRDAS